MAEGIPGAKFIEYPAGDHAAWVGDIDTLVGDIEEFVTGRRETEDVDIDRILATVLFTDIVDSTRKAAERAIGTGVAGSTNMTASDGKTSRNIVAVGSKAPATGCSRPSTVPAARCVARLRLVRRYARQGFLCAQACTPARSKCAATTSAGSRFTRPRE